MKTYGILSTQELVSLPLDDEGNPRFDTLKPADAGDDWTPPQLVPLIKLPMPELPAGKTAQPTLIWHADRVERDWILVDLTPEEIAAATRKAWPTVADFWSEFTSAEQLAIMDSAAPSLRLLLEALRMWRGEVWSDDARVTSGLDALTTAQVITDNRRKEIIAKTS
jgi:hypothetical protein